MNPLYMISLPVDLRELRKQCAVHGFGADEGRALHHFLCETFGKSAVQLFRLMPGRNGSPMASLYGYSSRTLAEFRQTAQETAMPESASLFDLERLAAKSMPEVWTEGRRLAFDIRIRPVKRLLKPLEAATHATRRALLNDREVKPFAKGQEVDAYLVTRLRDHPEACRDASGGMTREAVYRDWLAERLHGAMLDAGATRMVSCERARVLRGSRQLEAPDVVFHGGLTVCDPAEFSKSLAKGIGRHKAYGYGMLLLRPARG